MDLTDPAVIKQILSELKLFAQKKFGQNFLVDKDVLRKIISASDIKPRDTVIEVGPGLGALTRALADKSKLVVAVEKDPRMVAAFRLLNNDLGNVKLVETDALKIDDQFLEENIGGAYKLVANLPYYLTSALIRSFLQMDRRPDMMVLMVQKEVAERIMAGPPNANLLGISVQLYGRPEIVSEVPARSFWPTPKVDSSVIKITPFTKSPYTISDEKRFFRILKSAFGEKRKQIHNSLAGGLNLDSEVVHQALKNSNIDGKRRPQTLTIAEWIKLHHSLNDI